MRWPWLVAQATKGIDKLKAASKNMAFALGKYVVDEILTAAASGNVTNTLPLAPALTNLDTFDSSVRQQCNAQKMADQGRFLFLNTTLASALGADDRVKSALFFDQRNGSEGFRKFKNVQASRGFANTPTFPPQASTLPGWQETSGWPSSRLGDWRTTSSCH